MNTRSKKKTTTADVAMSDDFPSWLVAPASFMELASDSRIAILEDELQKIEERVVRALDRPLEAARQIFSKIFVQ